MLNQMHFFPVFTHHKGSHFDDSYNGHASMLPVCCVCVDFLCICIVKLCDKIVSAAAAKTKHIIIKRFYN